MKAIWGSGTKPQAFTEAQLAPLRTPLVEHRQPSDNESNAYQEPTSAFSLPTDFTGKGLSRFETDWSNNRHQWNK